MLVLVMHAGMAKLEDAPALGAGGSNPVGVQVLLPAPNYMYKIYVLKSLKDLRTYVGYAADISLRLQEHNLGKVNATESGRPLKIIFLEDASSLEMAKKREIYWKSGAGRRKLAKYFKEGFPPSLLGEARSNKI